MDCNGARALARRLEERKSAIEASPPEPLNAADAAPIFHWFGIEPPTIAGADDVAAAPSSVSVPRTAG